MSSLIHQSIFISMFLVMLASCSHKPTSQINDCSVKYVDNPGYKIVLVDGITPKRKTSNFITVVPYVLLDAGTHKLTIQQRSNEDKKEYILTENLKGGITYQLHFRDGSPALIPQ